MDTAEFVEFCRKELIKSFNNTKNAVKDDKHRHRIEGLLQAARLLRVLTKSEIELMMEEEHLAIFGETIESRSKRKRALEALKLDNPDENYDIPAFDRKG